MERPTAEPPRRAGADRESPVLTLILIGVLMAFLALSIWRANRRQRALAEERQRQAELAGGGGSPGPGDSPFGAFPFGGLFGPLLSGPGGWSRSLAYDPSTGEWVDISDQDLSDPNESPGAPESPPDEAQTPSERRRQRRERERNAQSSSPNPLSSLFGGAPGEWAGAGISRSSPPTS